MSFPLLSEGNELKFKSVNYVLEQTYGKRFSVDHANELFINLSSNRKRKIVRALYLGDWVIRRMWEVEGSLLWEVLSSRYFKELEYQKLYKLSAVREYTQIYTVMYDPWRQKWHCDCQFFSLYADIEPCTHISQIKIMNILKEFIPYFIYAYRFLLPHNCYLQFMSEFGHKPIE